MMRHLTRWAPLGCLVTAFGLLGLACGGKSARPGARLESNTNWLRLCEADAECSAGLACLCGLCSIPCEAATACSALPGASCTPSCGAAPAPAMCVLGCSSSAECGPDFECVDSACRPATTAFDLQSAAEEPTDEGSEAGPGSSRLPALGDPRLETLGPCPNAFISLDSAYALALADSIEQAEADQPYTRYVSLANRVNAGACPPELETLRSGLGYALNGTSRASGFGAPRAIDSDGVLYRIDLRDYTWERPVSLRGIDFDDAWDAVIASTPFAVELVGSEADELKARTGTAVPVVPADVLTSVAIDAGTYGALIGLPETLSGLFEALQIDPESNRRNGAAQRAGTTRSRLSRQDRVLERQPSRPGGPGVWLTFEFLAGDGGSALFEDPISLNEAAEGTVIFPLPNGLPAYALFDSDGRLTRSSELLLDVNMSDFELRAAVSCMNCHGAGLLGAEDEVRARVETNPDLYDVALRSAVELLYPPASDWAALSSADSAAYEQAKLRLGVAGPTDPAARAFIVFASDLTIADQAGDLMLPAALAATGLIESGGLGRDLFGAAFAAKSCAALASARNRPKVCSAP